MKRGTRFIGQRFGRLVVLKYVGGHDKHRRGMWRCLCDCGKEIVVSSGSLKKKVGTKSCGCFRKKHGRSGTPEHNCWKGMLNRCRNAKHSSFKHYGGRGISVCDRWNPRAGGSFKNFLADMGLKPKPARGYTIERKNDDGNYCPKNCYWATWAEQFKHRSNTNKKRRTQR